MLDTANRPENLNSLAIEARRRLRAAAVAALQIGDELRRWLELPYGVGTYAVVELPSGREIEVELKTVDGQWATRGDFLGALDAAKKIVMQRVEE